MNAKHAVESVDAWRKGVTEEDSGECNVADIFQLQNEVRSLRNEVSVTFILRDKNRIYILG